MGLLPELPRELVTEIMTKLPARSLMRFTCVSKLWRWQIRSGYFNELYLAGPSHPRLYMCLWSTYNFKNSELLLLVPDPDTPSTFVVDRRHKGGGIGGYILQNLGGFMCYVYWRKPQIYNPATSQYIELPFRGSKHMKTPLGAEKIVTYYFGYDSVNDKLKVVSLVSVFVQEPPQVIRSENRVLVASEDHICGWKKPLTPTTKDFSPHVPSKGGGGGVCIDGVIYYMAWTGSHKSVVVSFDIRSEEFNMIQVPHELPQDVTLLEYGGKPTLFDPTNLRDKGVSALWIFGSKKIWSCKRLVLQPSQLHLVNNSEITFKVKGTTQKGRVLLLPTGFVSPTCHILSYDLQSNDVSKIEIRGIPDYWFSMEEQDALRVDAMFMDQRESLMYCCLPSCFERYNHQSTSSIHITSPNSFLTS